LTSIKNHALFIDRLRILQSQMLQERGPMASTPQPAELHADAISTNEAGMPVYDRITSPSHPISKATEKR